MFILKIVKKSKRLPLNVRRTRSLRPLILCALSVNLFVIMKVMIRKYKPNFLVIPRTHAPCGRLPLFLINNGYTHAHIIEANGHFGAPTKLSYNYYLNDRLKFYEQLQSAWFSSNCNRFTRRRSNNGIHILSKKLYSGLVNFSWLLAFLEAFLEVLLLLTWVIVS